MYKSSVLYKQAKKHMKMRSERKTKIKIDRANLGNKALSREVWSLRDHWNTY